MFKNKTTEYGPGEFDAAADTHLNALRAGPNFQGLPEGELTSEYVEEAIREAASQTEFARGIQIKYTNSLPI